MVPETSETLWLILNFSIWAGLGAVTRWLFQVASSEEQTPPWKKGVAGVIASTGLAIILTMAALQVDHLKPWARVIAGAAGFLGHEVKTWIILLTIPVGKWIADKTAAWLKKRK